MDSHSAANLRNFSDVFIGWSFFALRLDVRAKTSRGRPLVGLMVTAMLRQIGAATTTANLKSTGPK
jgi:hypothetical protein